ncbi:hypothetical protein SLE2022_296540 [Rubroshorea leprosula]
MAFVTSKVAELPLKSSFPLSSYTHSSSLSLVYSSPKPSFRFLKPFSVFCTARIFNSGGYFHSWDNQAFEQPKYAASSLRALPSSSRPYEAVKEVATQSSGSCDKETQNRYLGKDKGQNAIERIVLRLRNLGLGSDGEEEEEETDCGDVGPVTGEERLGDLLKREWVRPDTMLIERQKEEDREEGLLPWERDEQEGLGVKKKRVRAPTLAELTIEDEELRRLRRNGMYLRERINVPKAGITQAVLEKIYDRWRKEELVRLKFHEVLACDMKTAHQVVERRTGGLVIWRSGSVMVVFRGSNYEGPSSKSKAVDKKGEALFVPDVSSARNAVMTSDNDAASTSTPEKSVLAVKKLDLKDSMTEEEAECNSLLDGLGPRFVEWWGTGVLPVDADLLPEKVPGYKTPFRLLPAGMRSRLTNAEMTNLRKLAKSLPCHFALGRNRNHQGLAVAILKLWEKSLVAKVAVKRGIQNTNNKLMAEELRTLTGGVLLLRNKYFIVIYRGKDFLPTTVAAALTERQEMTKQIQDVEEKARTGAIGAAPSDENKGQALAGTLAEFYEAQARWGREISSQEHEKMIEEASKAKSVRLVKRIEHKLFVAQAKKLRAEKLLAKIEASMVPATPDYDQETITDEERVMFRRVGLRMKAYLPLGVRGVFDGVIENMHLHWKHRELVKLITKQKTLAFVEDTARLLEYESGGILVAIEKVPKGYALIYYRGKNYRRPISLRPRNLLNKAKALKRSVAMQRHEALTQHISELERTIEEMKEEIGVCQDEEDAYNPSSRQYGQFDPVSEFSQSEDEASYMASDDDADFDNNEINDDGDNDDVYWDADEQDTSLSRFEEL